MASLADLQRPDRAGAADLGALPLKVERVRTFDTPEFAGMRFLEVEVKSALNRVSGMPWFGWSINPYRGCGMNCGYCFARPTHAYLNMSPLEDFATTIVVKTNLVEVLRREVARKSWRGEHVAMGTNVDPYQRAEGRYRLMPGVIQALAESRTPLSILTKGSLITRDIPLLQAAREMVEASAALTIGMLDETLWRTLEPGTPSPRARLEAVRKLNEGGIPTGVMLAPIMPGLSDTDEQLDALIDACAAAGATHISPIVLHLRQRGAGLRGPNAKQSPTPPPKWMTVREVFWPWLEHHHPDLIPLYERLYQARSGQATKAYGERITAFVAARREAAWRRHGRPEQAHTLRGGAARPAEAATPPGEQLSLLG